MRGFVSILQVRTKNINWTSPRMSILKLGSRDMTGGPDFQRGESIDTMWSVVVEVYGISNGQEPKFLVVHFGPAKSGMEHEDVSATRDVFN